MESTSTPRISAALMDSYIGRNVIIVGKVAQLRGDIAFIEADGQVQANLTRVSESRLTASYMIYADNYTIVYRIVTSWLEMERRLSAR